MWSFLFFFFSFLDQKYLATTERHVAHVNNVSKIKIFSTSVPWTELLRLLEVGGTWGNRNHDNLSESSQNYTPFSDLMTLFAIPRFKLTRNVFPSWRHVFLMTRSKLSKPLP